jgi:hypothetical protein
MDMIGKSPKNRPDGEGQEFADEEIAKRRDDGLRRLLKMPPKPHAEMVGKKKSTKRKKPISPKSRGR